MSYLMIIIGAAFAAYAMRLGGFLIADMPLPDIAQRALKNAPIAIFAALAVLTLPGQSGEGDIRFVAALIAGITFWRVRQLWAGLLAGMLCFWLLRML